MCFPSGLPKASRALAAALAEALSYIAPRADSHLRIMHQVSKMANTDVLTCTSTDCSAEIHWRERKQDHSEGGEVTVRCPSCGQHNVVPTGCIQALKDYMARKRMCN